jgi:thymidylate synthase (FAD)
VADLGWDLKDARLQDSQNRQNSIETDDTLLANDWDRAQKRSIYAAEREYKWALENGIAKEQARAVLPEGLTVSRLYMQGTLRSWLHYIELRSGPETQKEHRLVAQACADALEPIFPMVREFVSHNA